MDKEKITSVDYEKEKEQNKSNVNKDKETKKKSNAQKAIPGLIVAIVSLLIILTCVIIAYYQVYNSSKQNANVLEGVYASSYYSMVDNVNNLHVDVSKFSTLSTKQSKLNTLQDIMGDCNYILAGLSVLPIDEANSVSAIKFFNQVSGLSEAYMQKLNNGEELTQEETLMFDKISLVVGKIKTNFNKQNAGMYEGNFSFVDASIFDDSGMNELSLGMGDMTSESIDYPAMIFDGPFSTALETQEVKGLVGEEISVEYAQNYLKNTVFEGESAKITYLRETNGDISTYDFEVNLDGKDYDVQVSKVGSLVITISSFAENGDAVMSGEKAIEIAEKFANKIGFESMKSVWLEIHDNVAYINLAPVIDDVIYYPDLVKVKVDLASQQIIGFEAVNYAFNHTQREPEFNLTISECEEVLGFDYNILKTSKTVIRLDGGREISAYEFMCERIDGIYFYYIDANTGEVARTMKLVSVEGVEKLV